MSQGGSQRVIICHSSASCLTQSLLSLRAVVRSTLATSPPSVAGALAAAGRTRLAKQNATAVPDPTTLFVKTASGWEPSSSLQETLLRTRALYGCGMGLAALRVLTAVVEGAGRTRWWSETDSALVTLLAQIGMDVDQAIGSAKQEMDAERISDPCEVEETRSALLKALKTVEAAATARHVDSPFESAVMTVEQWKTNQSFGR